MIIVRHGILGPVAIAVLAFALAAVLAASPAAAQGQSHHRNTYGAWDVFVGVTDGEPTRCLARSIDAAAASFDIFWVYDTVVAERLPDGQLVADPRLLPFGGDARAIIDGAQTVDLVQGLDGFVRVSAENAAELAGAMREGIDMLVEADGDDGVRREVELSLLGFTAASEQAVRLCQGD